MRYLIASDLGNMPLSEINTAAVNSYVEWRLQVGARYGRFSSEAHEQWRWAALRSQPIEQVAQKPRTLYAVT